MQGIPRGIRCAVYDKVVANPTITNIEEARTLYLESGTKAIIAFGGGSAMDCAKVTGARIVKPNKPIHKMKGLLRICKKLPLLIAVLTTAGTGSETTLAAVITDSGAKHKYPINDFSLIPRYAVLDYHVTLGLPKNITATTGMDALTHAVETYIGRSTTKETRFMAEQATRLIYKNLKTAYDDGQNVKARENMLQAAYCAGIAFSRSYLAMSMPLPILWGGQVWRAPWACKCGHHALFPRGIWPCLLWKAGKIGKMHRYGTKTYQRPQSGSGFYPVDKGYESIYEDPRNDSGNQKRRYPCHGKTRGSRGQSPLSRACFDGCWGVGDHV